MKMLLAWFVDFCYANTFNYNIKLCGNAKLIYNYL